MKKMTFLYDFDDSCKITYGMIKTTVEFFIPHEFSLSRNKVIEIRIWWRWLDAPSANNFEKLSKMISEEKPSIQKIVFYFQCVTDLLNKVATSKGAFRDTNSRIWTAAKAGIKTLITYLNIVRKSFHYYSTSTLNPGNEYESLRTLSIKPEKKIIEETRDRLTLFPIYLLR